MKKQRVTTKPVLRALLDYNDRRPIPSAGILRPTPPDVPEFFRCAECRSEAFAPSLRQPRICVRCAAKQKATDPCPSS